MWFGKKSGSCGKSADVMCSYISLELFAGHAFENNSRSNGERGEVLSTFKQILRDESGWGFYEGLGLNFAVNFILYSLSTCK
ncbi:hypothetical protein QOT17_002431 [Balamuthia mandrillaris]